MIHFASEIQSVFFCFDFSSNFSLMSWAVKHSSGCDEDKGEVGRAAVPERSSLKRLWITWRFLQSPKTLLTNNEKNKTNLFFVTFKILTMLFVDLLEAFYELI